MSRLYTLEYPAGRIVTEHVPTSTRRNCVTTARGRSEEARRACTPVVAPSANNIFMARRVGKMYTRKKAGCIAIGVGPLR